MDGLELRKVAGKFYLERWFLARKSEPAQFLGDLVNKKEPLAQFFLGDFVGGFVIVALDQLPGRGDSDATKNSFGLADVNLFRRKINMGPQFLDLGLGRARRGGRIWNRQLGAVDIEGIEERFMVEQRRVINIERDFADDGERVLAVFEIVDPDVLRDETADRVDSEPLDRSFDAALVQFLADAIPPFLAKTALRQIPTGPAENQNESDDREPQISARLGMVRLRAAAVELPGEGRRRGFYDWRHC